MGTRFQPRSFTDEPEGFGRVTELRWREDGDQTQLVAAQLQHRMCREIRQRLKSNGMPLKYYATITDTDYWRLCRVLRGEVLIQLEDIAWAARKLGLKVAFEGEG